MTSSERVPSKTEKYSLQELGLLTAPRELRERGQNDGHDLDSVPAMAFTCAELLPFTQICETLDQAGVRSAGAVHAAYECVGEKASERAIAQPKNRASAAERIMALQGHNSFKRKRMKSVDRRGPHRGNSEAGKNTPPALSAPQLLPFQRKLC
jgi:hypothetical protein